MNGKARWIGIMALAIMLLALAAGAPVNALDMRGGDEIVIESDEVIDDDLYLAARIITVNGTINGDLVAAGSTVTINGVVRGDLIAAGQSIVISGDLQDDARLTAAIITLKSSATIGDDLVAAGYSLETEPGSDVGGSMLFFGGQALLARDRARKRRSFCWKPDPDRASGRRCGCQCRRRGSARRSNTCPSSPACPHRLKSRADWSFRAPKLMVNCDIPPPAKSLSPTISTPRTWLPQGQKQRRCRCWTLARISYVNSSPCC